MNQKTELANLSISVIIPVMNDWDNLKKVLSELNEQILKPVEIIIADSSFDDRIENSCSKLSINVPIKYLRVGKAFWIDRFLIKYFKFFLKDKNVKGRAYPYEATNRGAEVAKGDWLAFLDSTTNPPKNWLSAYSKLLIQKDLDLVIGKTKYYASTKFQHLLRACTYGSFGHETMPGSIIKTRIYLNNYLIREGVRAGGDVEWRQRVKSKFRWETVDNIFLVYSNLPTRFYHAIKKMFIYQLHSARVDIQHKVKDIYLGIFLFLTVLIIPKWNSIVGWESSPFFIPNITKIYLLSMTTLFFLTLLIGRGIFRDLKLNKFLLNSMRFSYLILLFIVVYNWNASIADWVEDSVWFIPHITKIFIFSLISIALIYRGIFFPLTHGIEKDYLFPINWLPAGILGVLLDIVKAPGYLIGAFLSIFIRKLD